jgi:hypothetical protein
VNPFSMGSAWSSGLRFVARRALGHAVILIGIGVLAPFALQYAVAGRAVEGVSLVLGTAAFGTGSAAGVALLVALALGYFLQSASYFASWRLGFGAGRSLAGPILYGFVSGLLALAAIAVVGTLAAFAAWQFDSSGVLYLAVLIFLIPLMAVLALFYTVPAALVAAAVSLLLGAAMVYGALVGEVGLAATMVGGSGGIAVLLLMLSAVLIWFAARLSCTACVMADRKSFDLIAAVRESWRLTWDEQWAIARYLALVGVGLALLIFAGAIVAGVGANAMLQEETGPALETGALILRLAAAVPLAFLTMMVPAGIYREVTASEVPADIFA